VAIVPFDPGAVVRGQQAGPLRALRTHRGASSPAAPPLESGNVKKTTHTHTHTHAPVATPHTAAAREKHSPGQAHAARPGARRPARQRRPAQPAWKLVGSAGGGAARPPPACSASTGTISPAALATNTPDPLRSHTRASPSRCVTK